MVLHKSGYFSFAFQDMTDAVQMKYKHMLKVELIIGDVKTRCCLFPERNAMKRSCKVILGKINNI